MIEGGSLGRPCRRDPVGGRACLTCWCWSLVIGCECNCAGRARIGGQKGRSVRSEEFGGNLLELLMRIFALVSVGRKLKSCS